jgi:hypothetical protein
MATSAFVVDGYSRARAAIEPQIRAELEGEFAARLEAANGWQRFWLWRAIEREVQARLDKTAPYHGHY